MKTKFLLLVLLLFPFVTVLKAQVDVGDSLALVDLYNSTGGANWDHNNNWLTKKPVDTWVGIRVRNQRVTHISLYYNNVIGTLPESIGHLDSLTFFSVSDNGISGVIPSSICNLKMLDALNLSSNLFSGKIPDSIGNLMKLTFLGLADNNLTGNIPSSLSNCSALTYIHLGDNKLTGPIPSLKKMTGLERLELYYNELSGTFDDVFAPQANLLAVDLRKNRLFGPFPKFVTRFSHLTTLYLADNGFTGQIPGNLGNLRQLQYIDVSRNKLSGNVPFSLFHLPYLFTLEVSDNKLTMDENPQYREDEYSSLYILADRNRFTFNGMEYLTKKYSRYTIAPQAKLSIHLHQRKLAVSAGGTLSHNTYKWFKAGEPKSVTINGDSTYEPATGGLYYATITNSAVIGLTLQTDTFTYVMPLANDELPVSISPNPVRGMIGMYGLNEKSDAKITIADMSGYVWINASSHQQAFLKIDVSRLKAGNYLVTVSDGKDVKTVMFVKE